MNFINYWDHLNTGISPDARKYIEDNSENPLVLQYDKRGPKEIAFLDTKDVIIHREDRVIYPFLDCLPRLFVPNPYIMLDDGKTMLVGTIGMPTSEATDLLLTPFTIRSAVLRPAAWLHKKLKPESYQHVDLDEFEKELDKHGGIAFLQVIPPPKSGQTDYIKCADGQRYVLDKKNGEVLIL